MTASLARMEEGKPSALGRCLLATNDFPLRQPRRISIHPGLVSIPGSQSVLETPSQPCPLGWEPCGSVRHPTGGRCRTFISLTKHDQLGGDLLREGAQRLPCFDLRHGSQHEGSHDREVVKACREFGNVCRVFGN